MNLKIRKIRTYIFLAMSVSFLFIGFALTSPTTADNNGMPEKLLSGQYRQRINMFRCVYENPCYNYISRSESSYILHGAAEFVELLGQEQPFTFQFLVNGHGVTLHRFAYQLNHDPHVIGYYFYHIYDAGTWDVGTYNVKAIWTAKGQEPLIGEGILVVTP